MYVEYEPRPEDRDILVSSDDTGGLISFEKIIVIIIVQTLTVDNKLIYVCIKWFDHTGSVHSNT